MASILNKEIPLHVKRVSKSEIWVHLSRNLPRYCLWIDFDNEFLKNNCKKVNTIAHYREHTRSRSTEPQKQGRLLSEKSCVTWLNEENMWKLHNRREWA